MKTLRLILLALGFQTTFGLCADDDWVLMGRFATEGGKPIFILKAPLKIGDRVVRKLEIANPGAISTQGATAERDLFVRGTTRDASNEITNLSINQVISTSSIQNSTASPNPISAAQQWSNSVGANSRPFRNTTNISVVNNQTVTQIDITAPPRNESGLSRSDEALVGRWSMTRQTDAVTAIPNSKVEVGLNFGNQVVFDLASNKRAAITINAGGPLGIENGGTILGTWHTAMVDGRPVLVVIVNEYSVSANPFGQGRFPKSVRWWIKHVGAGTLILREDSGFEMQLAK